jgi:cell shape-determining protein MreC
MNRQRQFAPTHTKTRRLRAAAIIIALGIIFAIPAVRGALRHGVSIIGLGISRSTHSVGGWFSGIATTIRSKHSLEAENIAQKAQIEELITRLTEHDQLARENADLKAAMGRNETHHFTLASVLAKPPHSIYDTLIIDGGSKVGFTVGQIVYANGETPIGRIEQVLAWSAIVRLYSAPGEKTEARLSPSNVDVTLIGRGGGNFSTTVAHDLDIGEGAAVVTKELNASVLAVFKKIISDERDPFQTMLLATPVNIHELSFVEVRQ